MERAAAGGDGGARRAGAADGRARRVLPALLRRRSTSTGIEPAPPEQTFSGELTIKVGAREVQLLEVGPAHTRGDTMAWLPAERVLFTGDILFSGAHPIAWAGPVSNWIAACERIEALAPRGDRAGARPARRARGRPRAAGLLRVPLRAGAGGSRRRADGAAGGARGSRSTAGRSGARASASSSTSRRSTASSPARGRRTRWRPSSMMAELAVDEPGASRPAGGS